MLLPCLSSTLKSHIAAFSLRWNLMSTLWPLGSVSRPRMSSSQSSDSCGEIKTLSISTPVALTSVKSCAPSVAAAVLLLVELELEAGELLVLEAGGGAVFLLAVLLVVVVVVVVVLALPGAVEEQAAVASRAAVKPHSNTLFFIFRSHFPSDGLSLFVELVRIGISMSSRVGS